jgi:diketogulonate reductase-like aldo/keto reductase
MRKKHLFDRRDALRAIAAGAASLATPALAQPRPALMRPIPSSGESIPLVGLGSWITFNVGNDKPARDACAEVMRAFFAAGGRMIDSSPMYGSSQGVIGDGLKKVGNASVFSAEKVWTAPGSRGPAQIEASRKFWGVAKFDLLQVHNLLAWEEHLRTLFAMKAAGQIRYIGITTSEGRRHADLETIMRTQPLDFVQLSYNILDREAESRLLPLARERGIAVIINRPFREGDLVRTIMRKPLPAFATEIGAVSWAQLILKFIISHPAVTCVIPATTRVDHVQENLAAARDPLPDAAMRARILEHVARL